MESDVEPPSRDGRPLIATAWLTAAGALLPPLVGLASAPPDPIRPDPTTLVYTVGGALFGLAAIHPLLIGAGLVGFLRWLGRERPAEPAPLPVLGVLPPIGVHVLATGLVKGVGFASLGEAALFPFEALLQWAWVAPAVTALAWRHTPLGYARAVALLASAGVVVAGADLLVIAGLALVL